MRKRLAIGVAVLFVVVALNRLAAHASGDVVELVIFLIAVLALAFVGRQIDRAREQAELATRDRDYLIAVVSHDLRNPLAGIQMCTELISRRLPNDAEARKLVSTLRLSVERMSALVRDLLDHEKIRSGTLLVAPKPLSVDSLFENLLQLMRPLAASKKLELAISPASERGLWVWCDRERIFQVFSNLIGNALKFTPADGTITLEAKARERMIELSVRDTGVGIPPEQLPHVFDRYWQARTRTRRQGLGLGLSIAQGILAAHGGRISVESAPGKGSTFRFGLAAASEPAVDDYRLPRDVRIRKAEPRDHLGDF